MTQARRAAGNISADARTVDGLQCTLSVWEDARAMKRYLYQGAHGKAVRDFDNFATGTTYGFETDNVPNWDEAVQLLKDHGR